MLDAAQQAIALSKQIASLGLEQEALYALTWVHAQLEDFDEAERTAQQVLVLASKAGDRMGEGNAHNVLCRIDMARGRYVEARSQIEKFLQIAREIDNQDRELTALNNLVAILIILGEYEEAREYGVQMLDLAIEVGDRVMEGNAYINLAWGTSTQADWQAAEEYALKGLALTREIHRPDALAEGLVWMGHIKLELNQPKEAEQAFRESLEIRHEIGQEALQAESMSGLSLALLEQGNLDAAQEYAEKIIEYIARDEELSGAWEPLRIYWTCYQVFRAVENPRKDNFLEDAVNILQKQAAKIPDEETRERFLTNVPWHQKIMAEWELVRDEKI